MTSAREVSHLVAEVARVSREHAHARKLLLCQTPAQGRELLRAAALAGFPWMGWEVTTPRTLAHNLILVELARENRARADDFDLLALSDAAIDAVEGRGEAGPFADTAGTAGYRDAIRRTLQTLREGGVTAEQLRRARPGDAKLNALAALLTELDRRLRERRLLDPAALMRQATEALQQGRAKLPAGRIFVLGGQSLRGVSGVFLQAVLASGQAQLLGADPVIGMATPVAIVWQAPDHPTGPLSALHAPSAAIDRPRVELFAAATPTDELREVLRRVVARGIPWDQVEILATDAVTYGAALDALARRLDIPVTYARGLDSRRTRSGRAVEAYLRWIGEGFPADILRTMLESGDLGAPTGFDDVSGAALARRLRRLRVGWGRDRYLELIDQAIVAADAPARDVDDVEPDQLEQWREREKRELVALRSLLDSLLSATPFPISGGSGSRTVAAGSRGSGAAGRTSPAALAAGVLAFLPLVPASGGMAESTMRKMLGERVGRIRDTLTRETGWEAAIGILRTNLVTRIAPTGESGLAPWTSTGGHLYLADLTTGGLSLRPHVFVVGMDASRVAAATGADPLLTDADRMAIAALSPSHAPVATSAERIVEGRHALAATLARIRGTITLSYSAWESAEGRSISPAPELLQALRLREGYETLTYEALRLEMGALAGAVPGTHAWLDGDDVWLGAIANGRKLREGTAVVRSVFPGLDAGLRARDARLSPEATAYDGVITPRPELDPLTSDAVFSATRLEALGTCPRRYFYQYVLGVFPVEDPVVDPDVWLDARQRGSLLHSVYERTLSEARAQEIDYVDEAFEAVALQVLTHEAADALRQAPPPSLAVHDQEVVDLREEVRTWVAMIRKQCPDWVAVELRFGPGEREAAIPAGRGQLRLRGAIDRVDRLPGGGLRIVDYKTGSPKRYRAGEPFAGGRRIQHVLYTLAAERLLGEPVESMEYHFPTRKGEIRKVPYGKKALARGPEVLEHLLKIAAGGHFVATDECNDCRFCQFAAVCRVSEGSFNAITSARATWSKTVGMEMGLAPYRRLKALRGIDG